MGAGEGGTIIIIKDLSVSRHLCDRVKETAMYECKALFDHFLPPSSVNVCCSIHPKKGQTLMTRPTLEPEAIIQFLHLHGLQMDQQQHQVVGVFRTNAFTVKAMDL